MEKKILSFEEAKLNRQLALDYEEDVDEDLEVDDVNDMILALIDAAFDESDISDEMTPEAMYKLAADAYADEYKRSNICHILAYMKKSAKMGYVPSMLFLGEYYGKAEGDRKADYHESFKWYKMAADSLSAEGAYHSAKCYESGKGVKKNLKKAFELYKAAADEGFAAALNELGRYYMYGISCECDEAKAYNLFKKSSDEGCPDALYNLSTCYLRGIGVEADFCKARELKDRADKLIGRDNKI